jgi:MFS family permease
MEPVEESTQKETVRVKEKSRHPAVILITLTLLVLLVSYVETMILPGVPEIQKDFGASATTTSWITSIVLLVGAACSPIFGKLGDARGKKKIFLVAIGLYTLGRWTRRLFSDNLLSDILQGATGCGVRSVSARSSYGH